MNDGDANVRLAAVRAASKVSTFTDVAAVSKLMGDSSPAVRQRGVELLGTLRSKDTVGGLLNVAKNDSIADVRAAACHSLGLLRDASARSTLEAIQSSDPNTFVQDQARIALRRI
jgi:HEAT repeat protein